MVVPLCLVGAGGRPVGAGGRPVGAGGRRWALGGARVGAGWARVGAVWALRAGWAPGDPGVLDWQALEFVWQSGIVFLYGTAGTVVVLQDLCMVIWNGFPGAWNGAGMQRN